MSSNLMIRMPIAVVVLKTNIQYARCVHEVVKSMIGGFGYSDGFGKEPDRTDGMHTVGDRRQGGWWKLRS